MFCQHVLTHFEQNFHKPWRQRTTTTTTKLCLGLREQSSQSKIKLKLQTERRALYEKEFDRIMNILKIPEGSRNYTDILPKITELFQLHEQNETEHISNGLSLIESVTRQE